MSSAFAIAKMRRYVVGAARVLRAHAPSARGKGGREKRENGPALRQYASSASPRERDRAIDPNSPFAKLAALKEQLTAGRKDR